MDRRDLGFVNFSSVQKMVLHNTSGQQSTRVMENQVLEGESSGDKTLIIFREPKKIRGTALLTHAHQGADDDQWLFLPKLDRVKRISGASKAGSFLGSEFAYEDLAPQEVDDYQYKFIRDDIFNGEEVFVVERYPKDKDSGYTRQILWVDKTAYRIQRAEFYDRKEALAKTLEAREYKLYLDKYWRPHNLTMVNEIDGKRTELLIDEYQFRVDLADDDFTQASLRRAR
ncbi:MAG TPA: outer membrane lipoprotein-sorting protein [Gammaproteobacteria bacterium]|nr:outer membrane lipoprotein-sorting protein [Gammaproteobacteria bacterium]